MAIANNKKIGFVYVNNDNETFNTTSTAFKNAADSSIVFYSSGQIAIGTKLIADKTNMEAITGYIDEAKVCGINMGTSSGSSGNGESISSWLGNPDSQCQTHNIRSNRCVNDVDLTFICISEDGAQSDTWTNQAEFPLFFPRYSNLEYILCDSSLRNGVLTVPKIGTDSFGVFDVLEPVSINLRDQFVSLNTTQTISASKEIYKENNITGLRLSFKEANGNYVGAFSTPGTSISGIVPSSGSNMALPNDYGVSFWKWKFYFGERLGGYGPNTYTNQIGTWRMYPNLKWVLDTDAYGGYFKLWNINGYAQMASGANMNTPSISLDGSTGSINITGGMTAQEKISAPEFFISSDSALKKNQVKLTDYDDINVFEYNWQTEDGEELYGFIAQEVEREYPDMVSEDPQTGIKQVNYNAALALMIVKLNDRIKELERKLEEK